MSGGMSISPANIACYFTIIGAGKSRIFLLNLKILAGVSDSGLFFYRFGTKRSALLHLRDHGLQFKLREENIWIFA